MKIHILIKEKDIHMYYQCIFGDCEGKKNAFKVICIISAFVWRLRGYKLSTPRMKLWVYRIHV